MAVVRELFFLTAEVKKQCPLALESDKDSRGTDLSGKSLCRDSMSHFKKRCCLCLQVTGVPFMTVISGFADCTRSSALQAAASAEMWRLEMTKLFFHRHGEHCCKLFKYNNN